MRKWILILSIIASYNTYAAVHCPEGTTLDVDCWQCGDDCTAYLSDDNINNGKTLNIKGSGTMTNWVCDKGIWPSWYAKSDEITSAVIEGKSENSTGITSIGAWTFMKLTNLKSVDIPDSVTTIEGSAFKGTTSLETIEIPSSVTDIGSETFYNSGITSIAIPDSVTTIQTNAFLYAGGYAGSTIWCAADTPCANKGSNNIQIYSIDKSGVYKAGDAYYATFQDFARDIKCDGGLTQECIAKALENRALVLKQKSDICKTEDECLALVHAEYYNGTIQIGNKSYVSIEDLINGHHILKRIYTIEEAERVSKPSGNTFKIRYK